MDFRYARPCGMSQQHLATKKLHNDLAHIPQANEQYQHMALLPPQLHQAHDHQCVQYPGQTTIVDQGRISPPDPGIHPRASQQESEKQMAAQLFLEQEAHRQ